jgi:hypothetical protein
MATTMLRPVVEDRTMAWSVIAFFVVLGVLQLDPLGLSLNLGTPLAIIIAASIAIGGYWLSRAVTKGRSGD